MKLNETFEDAVDYTKNKRNSGDFIAHFDFNPELDIEIEVEIMELGNNKVAIHFHSVGSIGPRVQEKGQITYKIFSTIIQIIQDHVEEYDIEKIRAPANTDKKADIYEKLLNRFANGWDVYRMGTTVLALKN
jgi:hypothetical protein